MDVSIFSNLLYINHSLFNFYTRQEWINVLTILIGSCDT